MKDISVSISYRDKMVIIFSVAMLGLMLLGKFAPIIAIYIFIGVAIIALITLIAKSSTTKWVELDAKIIATEKKAVKSGIMLFHIYEYEYEGKEYRSMSNVGSACGKGNIGHRVKIKVDANNPHVVKTDMEFRDLTGITKFYIVAMVILVLVIWLMVFFS
jgi:Na+-transporting NADH:ubiquinone oxidoreductase subunit NqrF